jgi:hypothetical protein
MGSAPAEIRRISSARPRLSVAARPSEHGPPEASEEPKASGAPGTRTISTETTGPRATDPRVAGRRATGAGTTDSWATGAGTTDSWATGAGATGAGTLPVLPALRGLLPRGGLARGTVVTVAEFGLLALALAAGASADGAWCGIAGVPEAGVLAAAALGLDAERTLLVPDPGHAWAQVVASLLDGCELVLLRPPARAPTPRTPGTHGTHGTHGTYGTHGTHETHGTHGTHGAHGAQARQRLEATLRRGRGVLLVVGDWPGAQVRLRVLTQGWTGLGDGHGRLRACCAQVMADGRGELAVPRSRWLWLPAEDGRVTVAEPAAIPVPDSPAAHRLQVASG